MAAAAAAAAVAGLNCWNSASCTRFWTSSGDSDASSNFTCYRLIAGWSMAVFSAGTRRCMRRLACGRVWPGGKAGGRRAVEMTFPVPRSIRVS